MPAARCAVLGCLLLVATTASGQAIDPVRVGFRLGAFGLTNASDSYDAVYGDPMPLAGAALGLGFPRGWFFQLSADYGTIDGEQVVLLPEPLPTGFETTLRMMPLHLTGGKRFGRGLWRFGGGFGPTYVSWKEETELGSVSDGNVGGHVLLGVERGYGAWIVGGDLVYSVVPDAIGRGGVSGELGEDDIGGIALMLRVSHAF